MSRQVIGIDYGTTFSSVSFLPLGSPDRPSLLQFSGARHHVPTMLRTDPNDESVLDWGWEAHASLRRGDRVTVRRDFKRMLGQTEEARELTLAYLRSLAETIRVKKGRLPELTEDDFLTAFGVPAGWSDAQAELLRELAVAAGFPDVRIVQEPVAAMHNLRCSTLRRFKFGDRPETFMVVDFGGGTLDICVVKTQELGREPQVLSVDGDPELGGMDFDELIEKWFIRQSGVDVAQMCPADLASLREQIQDAKENMSNVFLKCQGDGLFQTTIHLSSGAHTFEATKSGLVNRCQEQGYMEKLAGAVTRALTKCGLQASEIKRVILTGGSSAWFFVRQIVAREMGLGDPSELLGTDSPYTDVASGLGICYGRSDEPPSRSGVWLDYKLPGGKQERKILAAPGRINPVQDDKLFLGSILGSSLFRSKAIKLEWFHGDSDAKSVTAGRAEVELYLRSNHPKLKTMRNVWDVLRGRPTAPLEDHYMVNLVTNEDPLTGVGYELEVMDNRGNVRRTVVRPGEKVRHLWFGLGGGVREELEVAKGDGARTAASSPGDGTAPVEGNPTLPQSHSDGASQPLP